MNSPRASERVLARGDVGRGGTVNDPPGPVGDVDAVEPDVDGGDVCPLDELQLARSIVASTTVTPPADCRKLRRSMPV